MDIDPNPGPEEASSPPDTSGPQTGNKNHDLGEVCDLYEGSARISSAGDDFLDRFDQDVHAHERIKNPYYPFLSKVEWELASFLLRSDMSMKRIDEFLKLELVCTISF